MRPPKTLCIHLNRLSYDNYGQMYLNRNFVEFPSNLDLKEVKDACPFEIDLKYELRSVIEHFGTPQFGHYVAAKRDGEGWVLCNDKVISKYSEEGVRRSKAYMLFYDKV